MDHKLALTIPRDHSGVGGGGREDCWSEGGTETLIEAWGDRYLQLNRGNLRQKDWKEVADAVNANRNGGRVPRTDVQCKNRIDTLKKKYKLEKSKPSPSKWPFFFRLEHLIGPNTVTPSSKKKSTTTPSLSVRNPIASAGGDAFTVKSKGRAVNPNPNPNPSPSPSPSANFIYSGRGSSRLNSSGSNESSLGVGEREDKPLDDVDFSSETSYKELARAILRFGEIYERVESSKQEQMMELEKQRMEFTKDLEFQRMNMFMDAQLEIEKMIRKSKGAATAGKKL